MTKNGPIFKGCSRLLFHLRVKSRGGRVKTVWTKFERNNKKTPKDLPLETLVLRQKLYKKFEKLEVIKKELESLRRGRFTFP